MHPNTHFRSSKATRAARFTCCSALLILACSERRELLIGRLPNQNDTTDAGANRARYLIQCGVGPEAPPSTPQGTLAQGHIPTVLAPRVGIGLEENRGETWMKNSSVAWDYRWAYFSPTSEGNDWYNDWGFGPPDGAFATSYFEECAAQGFTPVVQYFNLSGDYAPAGDTSQTLTKLQNSSVMNDYFAKFTAFMQRARAFAKPVIVIVEGSTFGYIQQQSHSNGSTFAAIASSGLPDLASLPDTVAGFGLAFLALRKAVSADNVILGIDIPFWATGDFILTNTSDDIQPHVDAQYAFLSPFGLTSNVTGETFDFTANSPVPGDFDWLRLGQPSSNQRQDVWWDPNDDAALTSRSFNRYAEWLKLFNQASSRRWILWQLSMGNSNSPNLDNPNTNGGSAPSSAAGWKDNRAEYFFCSQSNRHLGHFADAGVIGLLFGAGGAGCTDQTSDYYFDGQPFLKTHAGTLLAAGGFLLTK